ATPRRKPWRTGLIVATAAPSLGDMGKTHIQLPDWNTLAALDDAALPLLPTALLIARDEYPGLDPAEYDALVQSHADHLRTEVQAIESTALKMAAINRHLFEEVGRSEERRVGREGGGRGSACR